MRSCSAAAYALASHIAIFAWLWCVMLEVLCVLAWLLFDLLEDFCVIGCGHDLPLLVLAFLYLEAICHKGHCFIFCDDMMLVDRARAEASFLHSVSWARKRDACL
jgi:hypothetical protein